MDKQLREWQILNQKYPCPKQGWVKTLRKALGMTAQQLAERLGLTRSRIVQLEEAEKDQAITLRVLKKAAEAMDCELIYVIVPKVSLHGHTLKDIIEVKAAEVAENAVNNVSYSMYLENQEIKKNQRVRQKKELTKKLLAGSLKKIWNRK